MAVFGKPQCGIGARSECRLRAVHVQLKGLDAIFANAPYPYTLLDPDLRMVWAGTAYLEVTGRTDKSTIGKLMTEAFPARYDSVSDEMPRGSFRRVLTTGKPGHLSLPPYPTEDAKGHLVERY